MKLHIEHYGDAAVTSELISWRDLEVIQNINSVVLQMREKAKKLLDDAQVDAKKITLQAEMAGGARAKAENAILIAETEEKLDAFFTKLESEIFAIIYRIMLAMGIEQISVSQLKNLIQSELNNIIVPIEQVVIIANSKLLSEFKVEFGVGKLQYKPDDTLHDAECIYETEYYRLKIDANLAKDKIRQYLTI
jgi:hypothetical protein